MFKNGVLLFPTIFSVTNMKKANLPQTVILKANGDHAACPQTCQKTEEMYAVASQGSNKRRS